MFSNDFKLFKISNTLQFCAFASLSRPLVDLHNDYVAAVGCPVVDGNVESTVKCLRSKTPAELASKMFMFDQCNLHDPGILIP